ncbi:YopX family protein [uncultured Alistipes sp.]|uniref:YopX family protein n=1 Tax=uncultured Alistipes sp. TaxID=538949 RepID=UPI00206EF741|nr:YopX family protein [uncultured Alistipes sp.]DAP59016.1 MAG TPA: YopX protein [Caudoviricetes sp.]
MRTIKFRGKRICTGEWVYGSYAPNTYDEEKALIITYFPYDPDYVWEDVDPATVGEYTGMKDKNGKEIYEGDIFKDSSGVLRTVFRVPGGLAFEENPVAFGYDHRAPVYPYSPLAESQNEAWISQCCEVIGNIHDNPELLKGGEQ